MQTRSHDVLQTGVERAAVRELEGGNGQIHCLACALRITSLMRRERNELAPEDERATRDAPLTALRGI